MADSCAEAAVVAEVELSAAPPGCTARLILDLGYADAAAAAVARDLATGVLAHIEVLLAGPAADLPAHLPDALAALGDALDDALGEQSGGPATVTTLDTPLARAWHTDPAGQDR